MVNLDLIRPNLTLSSIILSQRCNIDCRMCFIPENIRRSSPKPNLIILKKIIDSFGEIKEVKQLGISGGEPFLFINDLVELFDYSNRCYGFIGTVNTNAFWATSVEKTKNILSRLFESGLRYIGVSVDSFHQEFVPINNVYNLIMAAADLSITIFVQTITGRNTWDKSDVKRILGKYAQKCEQILDTTLTITENTNVRTDELPTASWIGDGCSIFRLLQSDQNGNIRFCCGPAESPSPNYLYAGNVFADNIETIIAKSSVNPIFNSLYINNGPSELMKISDGLFNTNYFLHTYTSCCEACNKLMQNPLTKKLYETIISDSERYYVLRKYKEEIEKERYMIY